MVLKSVYVADKQILRQMLKFYNETRIADVWEVAGTKQTTEWGGMKQYLAILELQGLINVIKQLDINTDLNKYKQM